jgi:hypothetical protein
MIFNSNAFLTELHAIILCDWDDDIDPDVRRELFGGAYEKYNE